MFWRMVKGALLRQKGKMLMIAFTIALGASLATAMLNVMLDVGDKVNQELKTYGANINVRAKEASLLDDLYGMDENAAPAAQYLRESELGNIKTIFWAFNIVDFAPYLETRARWNGADEVKLAGVWFNRHLDLPTGESLNTGILNMKNWWAVAGEWPGDDETDSALVGALLAERYNIGPGDRFTLAAGGRDVTLRVSGVLTAGGDEDEQVFVPLPTAQKLADKPGLVNRVEVSALTTPDNELSRRAAQNPKSLSIKEWETWYCTAYVSAICYQIDEVMTDAVSKPIRRVAESEGAILEKTQLLMLLITILSLLGSALGISNLVTASVMERSREIGLLKAVGANNTPISALILAEIMATGLFGGVAGYFAGLGFAQIIGRSVFGAAVEIKPMVIPIVAILVFVITLAGSIPSIRYMLSLHPAEVLHGR
ncbi:MAG: ABC transporter permease [Gracilibacteraceae bacterium]|jgi:putative ABC transport system permease protein|nr:ABC transporter permease [Gracilibacteraceae bacterium]